MAKLIDIPTIGIRITYPELNRHNREESIDGQLTDAVLEQLIFSEWHDPNAPEPPEDETGEQPYLNKM